jgi:hypothetical protein
MFGIQEGRVKKLHGVSDYKDWKLRIEYQYTVRDTPQQNHLAELGFAVLANHGIASLMVDDMGKCSYEGMVSLLFREAFSTATLLDGLMTMEIDGVTATKFIFQSKILHLLSTYKPGTWLVQ